MKQSRTTKSKRGSAKTNGRALGPTEIKFYRANERPYGVFSNLYRSPVEFDGMLFPTAEHAYQAGKALKPQVRNWILSAPTPSLAAMAAHGLYTWDIVPNWAQVKFERMRRVLRAKFTQHPALAQLLIGTGKARLVEAGTVNTAVNRLWGEVNGVGQNMLGVMLMELRHELLQANSKKPERRGKKVTVDKQLLRYSSANTEMIAVTTE